MYIGVLMIVRLAAHRILQSADDGHQDEKSRQSQLFKCVLMTGLIRRLDLVTATSVHLTSECDPT
jgi:hypothetical protein